MKRIDRKFKFIAINPYNGNHYTEKNAVVFCAKDRALPAALAAYADKCVELGCSKTHVDGIEDLMQRVINYQKKVEQRIPDTEEGELSED